MSIKTNQPKQNNTSQTLFSKENYSLMIVGLVLLGTGFFLMAGGKSKDINMFDAKEVYSTTRITVAPILIILGFVVEVFAIMRKPKSETPNL